MGSSGKKKTTMAKLARENRLRERRLNKQIKKQARKQSSLDELRVEQLSAAAVATPAGGSEPAGDLTAQAETSAGSDPARAFRQVDPEPLDPRSKELALERLRAAPDEELALFESKLRDDAIEAGATEPEMREAQRGRPEQV